MTRSSVVVQHRCRLQDSPVSLHVNPPTHTLAVTPQGVVYLVAYQHELHISSAWHNRCMCLANTRAQHSAPAMQRQSVVLQIYAVGTRMGPYSTTFTWHSVAVYHHNIIHAHAMHHPRMTICGSRSHAHDMRPPQMTHVSA